MTKTILTLCGFLLISAAFGETVSFNSGTKQVTLVELFTSQGCSSCPPAENWINQHTDNPKLWNEFIPIAFHVDYWDGLGWKDIYAREKHSSRQYRYKRDGNIDVVYTPGFLVDGQEWRGWRFANIPVSNEQVGTLSVTIDEQGMNVKYTNTNKQQPLQLHVAILGFDINTSVTAGENRGRDLEQQFLVLAHNQISSAQNQWQTELPSVNHSAGKYGFVAWVSSLDNQKPIQATGGWLPSQFVQ